MTSSRRSALSLLLCLATIAPTGPAGAQAPTAQDLETARSLYKQGKELRAHGDVRGALEKLRAAHALGNTPVTGIELARTYVLVGQIVEARETCLSIARMPVASDETGKSVEARADAAKLADDLEPRIPTLVVKVAGLLPGEIAHVSIDGAPIPGAATSEPQKVDPGEHTVVARAGEGRGVEGIAEVVEGQAAELTLTLPQPLPAPPHAPEPAPVLAAPPPPAPGPVLAPEPPPRTPASASLVKIGFSVAGAAGVAGTVAGLVAIAERSRLDGLCTAQKECDSRHGGTSALSTAYTWATVSNVSFALAGAGVVTAVVGLVSGHSSDPGVAASLTPWIGPGRAGIDGRF